MTFADYWAAMTARNDGLLNVTTRMSMTVGEFARQLRRAYEAGYSAGENAEYDNYPTCDRGRPEPGPEVMEMLETMFGKGFNNKQRGDA